MKPYFLLSLCVLLLSGCLEDEAPDPRKKYTYHVFIRADDASQAFYAGTTIGLGSCAIIGRRTLLERAGYELAGNEWRIVCCWETKSSQCQEEHRYQDKDIPYEEWKRNPEYHITPWRQYFFK